MTVLRRLGPVALLALLALALVAGAALAGGRPHGEPRSNSDAAPKNADSRGLTTDETDETDETDAALDPARYVDLLAKAGIETDAAAFGALADRLGAGGAVRAIAWADALADDGSTMTPAQIADAFEQGTGWGRLARELEADTGVDLHPGIGWIMRGAGDEGDDESDTPETGRPDDPGAPGRAMAAPAGRDDRP